MQNLHLNQSQACGVAWRESVCCSMDAMSMILCYVPSNSSTLPAVLFRLPSALACLSLQWARTAMRNNHSCPSLTPVRTCGGCLTRRAHLLGVGVHVVAHDRARERDALAHAPAELAGQQALHAAQAHARQALRDRALRGQGQAYPFSILDPHVRTAAAAVKARRLQHKLITMLSTPQLSSPGSMTHRVVAASKLQL